MASGLKIGVAVDTTGYQQSMETASQATETLVRSVDELVQETEPLKKQLRNAKKESDTLAIAFHNLSEEEKNSKFGQELRARMDAAIQKTAELTDMNGDLAETYKNLADDQRWVNTLKDGFELLVSATTGVIGTIAAFTGNEEDANRATGALTAAIGLLNTANQVQAALQKQSNLMLAIGTLQTKAKAAADKLAAKATGELTIAQRAFNIVAKANPYVLLGTAAVALIGIMLGVNNAMKKSEEEIEAMKKEAEETKKVMDEQRNTMVNASSSMMETASRISYLQGAYSKANDELSKTSILKQAQSEFKKLGLECKSLNDAQTLLIKQGPQILEMIRLQGEAAAVSALRMEAFKKSFSMLLENGYDIDSASILAGYNATVLALDKRAEKLNQRIMQLKSQLPTSESRSTTTRNTVQTTYTTDSLAALEHKLSDIQSKYKNGLIKLFPDDYKRIVEDLERQIKEKKSELGLELPETTEQKLKNEIARLQSELAFTLEGSVDEAEIKRLIALYQERLDKEQARLKVEPELKWTEQDQANLYRRLDEIANPNKEFEYDFDFSNLPDKFKDAADKLSQELEKSKSKLEAYSAVMNEPDASDAQIAEAQKRIDAEKLVFEELKKQGQAYEEMANKQKKLNDTIQASGDMLNSLGSIASSVSTLFGDNAALNATAIIAQAVANYILGWTEATAKAAELGPIGWAAFGLSTAAQVFAMIAQIKNAAKFADGGVVRARGGLTTGDKILARLNEKELVLNQKQQQKVLDMLDNNMVVVNNQQTVNVVGTIKGEDIVLTTKRVLKKAEKQGRKINIIG